MCNDGKGCGDYGECVRMSAKPDDKDSTNDEKSDGKKSTDVKKTGDDEKSTGTKKTGFVCKCKDKYSGDGCEISPQTLVAATQHYWAWSYEGMCDSGCVGRALRRECVIVEMGGLCSLSQ